MKHLKHTSENNWNTWNISLQHAYIVIATYATSQDLLLQHLNEAIEHMSLKRLKHSVASLRGDSLAA
jgi:hypothetical protein